MKIILYIIVLLAGFGLTTFIDLKFLTKDKTKGVIVKSCFKDFFIVNLTTLGICVFPFGLKHVFNPLSQDYLFFLFFFIASLVVGGLYLLIKWLVYKFFILEKVELKRKKLTIFLYILSIVMFFIGVFAFTGTVWCKATYGTIRPDQLLTTLLSPITGTDPVIVIDFVENCLLVSAMFTYIFALIFYKRVNYKFIRQENVKFMISEYCTRVVTVVIGSVILTSGLFYCAWRFELKTMLISYFVDSPYIEENYIDPANVKLEFPEEKRNLIHIYLESVENSYLDKANGGGYEKGNLIPNLLELSKDGYNFSHMSKGEGLGGPLECYGATWSVASMVNQSFGFPMKAPTRRNAYGKKGGFFPGALGTGDILKKVGYEQTVMFGADAAFGGLDNMFSLHGDFKIMDHQYALKHNMLPTKDYKVNWGYEDEKLYKFAQDELTRLSETGKPFHFVMENADTHYPGFIFEGDKPVFGYSKATAKLKADYGKTIQFSEKHVVEFIRWIQAQPFYENSTVVIIGDHLSMDKKFFTENNFKDYTRTTYNLILNPSPILKDALKNEELFYDRTWATYDFMPTILASIGVKIDGNRLGLGTNLFSGEKTLFERDGYNYVYNQYIKKSPFYNENFLSGKLEYDGENLFTY